MVLKTKSVIRVSTLMPIFLMNLLLGLLMISPLSSSAQGVETVRGFSAQPRSITIESVEPPRSTSVRTRLIDIVNWVQIEVVIEAIPEDLIRRLDYIKDLEVKIHWLTPEPSRDDVEFDQRQVFSLSQSFAHLKPARQMAFIAFIPPTWVERFGGESRIRSASNVAVEVSYNSKAVIEVELRDRGSRAGDNPDWFRKEGKTGVLLPISETPWMNDFWDRYYRPYKTSLK